MLQAVQFCVDHLRHLLVNISPQTFDALIVHRPPSDVPNSASATAPGKKLTTTSAEFSVAHRMYVMQRDKPSMHPCVDIPHLQQHVYIFIKRKVL